MLFRSQEILWQLLFQGVLVGCCAFFALNYATLAIGSQTVGVLSALVPVIGALCSMLITRDSISSLEWTAIVVSPSGLTVIGNTEGCAATIDGKPCDSSRPRTMRDTGFSLSGRR